jgi:hypothetical protein
MWPDDLGEILHTEKEILKELRRLIHLLTPEEPAPATEIGDLFSKPKGEN